MSIDKYVLKTGGIIMSEKMRNTFRSATMRNFSKYTIVRYIYIDDKLSTDEEKDLFVKEINERLWAVIQDVNAYAKNRVLPFVIVRRLLFSKIVWRFIRG